MENHGLQQCILVELPMYTASPDICYFRAGGQGKCFCDGKTAFASQADQLFVLLYILSCGNKWPLEKFVIDVYMPILHNTLLA